METIRDFEDMLYVMEKHRVRYLIIGGLAVIYHAKPRYTKQLQNGKKSQRFIQE